MDDVKQLQMQIENLQQQLEECKSHQFMLFLMMQNWIKQERTRAADSKDSGLKCSFCGKSQKNVRKLIAGPGVQICDECTGLCSEILVEEGVKAKAGQVAENDLIDDSHSGFFGLGNFVQQKKERPAKKSDQAGAKALKQSKRAVQGKKEEATVKCSFCGKSQDNVEYVIAGPGVNICDACVIICNDIIDDGGLT